MLPLPLRILAANNVDKEIWRRFDAFRERTKPDPNVFADTTRIYNEGANIFGLKDFESHQLLDQRAMIRLVHLITALAAWRPTQDIISFDENIYKALLDSDFGNSIPKQVLAHFPAWSLWFDTPYGFHDDTGTDIDWQGFFVTVDGNGDRLNFVFVGDDLDNDGVTCSSVFIHLGDNMSEIKEKINKSYENVSGANEVKNVSDLGSNLSRALSLLIYVCANGLDDNPGALTRSISRPQPVKTKKGWRVFPAQKPAIRKLGVIYEQKLKEANEKFKELSEKAEHSGTKRPHMRRGHWHGYWMGSKKSEQTLDVRWLMPMLVALKNDPEYANNLQP